MADNSLQNFLPAVKDDLVEIRYSIGGKPAVISTEIAQSFDKEHFSVLRCIKDLLDNLPKLFTANNFVASEYQDKTGRKLPCYLLTRDAFSLLVMGFTGKAALLWKLRYIEAFNALEQAAKQKQENIYEHAAELAREAGYIQGRQETLCLPVMEAERKRGYLEGMKEGERLARKNDHLTQLVKILRYREKGLTSAEIGKILDLRASAVRTRLSRARRAGLIAGVNVKTTQANLLEVA